MSAAVSSQAPTYRSGSSTLDPLPSSAVAQVFQAVLADPLPETQAVGTCCKRSAKPKNPPKVFTFSLWERVKSHSVNKGLQNTDSSVELLQQFLKECGNDSDLIAKYGKIEGEVTRQHLFNCRLDRHFLMPIDLSDETIPLSVRLNYRDQKSFSEIITEEKLSAYLGRQATGEEVLNCNLKRPLDQPFVWPDSKVCPKWEINSKAKRPLGTPVGQIDLSVYLGRRASWQEVLNCNDELKKLTEKIPYRALEKYIARFRLGGYEVRQGVIPLQAQMNWFLERNLRAPIDYQEYLEHPWKDHINLGLERECDTPVTPADFEKLFGLSSDSPFVQAVCSPKKHLQPKKLTFGKPQLAINSSYKDNPLELSLKVYFNHLLGIADLGAPIFEKDFKRNFPDVPITPEFLVNCNLERDPKAKVDWTDPAIPLMYRINHLLGKEIDALIPFDLFTDLFLKERGRRPLLSEWINCSFLRREDTPIAVADLEKFFCGKWEFIAPYLKQALGLSTERLLTVEDLKAAGLPHILLNAFNCNLGYPFENPLAAEGLLHPNPSKI